jgi:two-component sensor histidine kinase/PAS domain-containing protein
VLFGLGLTAAAALLRAALQPIAPGIVPFASFYVSTLLAALIGGTPGAGAALAAAAVSCWYLFLPPFGAWNLDLSTTVNLALFAVTQAAVASVALLLRAALRRVAAAEATLRAVFEQLPAAAFTLERGNDGAASRLALRSVRTLDILPGEDPLSVPAWRPDGTPYAAAAHPALRALATGEVVDAEPVLVGEGAARRQLEVFARPVRDADGRIVASVCTAFDVTARQRAEESWQAKAAELEGVMTLAPVGVWFTHDPDVRRVVRNRFASELLGLPEGTDSPLGATPPDRPGSVVLHRGGRPVPAEDLPLQRAVRGEESRDEEFEAVFADGTRKVLLSNARPLRNAAGRIIGAVSASLDITARKRAEAALRDAIAQRELLQREADHRIKNSLHLVASMLRLQRGRLRDAEAAGVLDGAIARVAAVAEAHGALQGSPDLRTVDLGAMLGDLCRFVAKLNTAVAISMAAEGRHTLDAQRAIPLGLMVTELLTNAVRHAFPDGAAGAVRVRLAAAGPGRLLIEVADDGVGMASDARRPGSLGTAIIQSLAGRVGGTIEIQTGPGQGTRATILVPVQDLDEAAA